jgi:Fe-S-cluster-containing dehydrogenase component
MTSYGMVFDLTKCIGCENCLLACKDEFVGNDYQPYSLAQPNTQYGYGPTNFPSTPSQTLTPWVINGQSWIVNEDMVLGTYPSLLAAFVQQPCMMCENPPCVAASSGGVVYTRDDGIVIIDPTSSQGQNLVASCPYGRIYWNSTLGISQKCTFCAHLIDAGGVPKCVQACIMSVITFGDLDDPKSAISALVPNAEVLHPEYNTKPNVYYIGLPHPFLKGTVVNATTDKCVQSASVTLASSSTSSLQATTDNYGEFTFKNVLTGVTYTLTITATGLATKTLTINFVEATDVGEIDLYSTS